MKLRNRFMQFYLEKRYETNDAAVESFVKNDENIFRARSRLPKTFWLGFLATGFYAAAFFVMAYWPLRRLVYQS
jgi:hypothetical protein